MLSWKIISMSFNCDTFLFSYFVIIFFSWTFSRKSGSGKFSKHPSIPSLVFTYHQNYSGLHPTVFWGFVFVFSLVCFSAKCLFLHLYCNHPPQFPFHSRRFLSLWPLAGQCWDFPRAKPLWPFQTTSLWAFQLGSCGIWRRALPV